MLNSPSAWLASVRSNRRCCGNTATPLALRLFGFGHIVVTATDNSNPSVTLRAVPYARQLRDQMRQHVEVCRDRKRVRVSEFE